MEIEKTPSGVIAVFVEGLENTPGWQSLSRKKQDELLQRTSNIQQNRQLRWLGEFGELMELHQIHELLEGEEMQMKDYLLRLYPGRHKRTIDRKRQIFEKLLAKIPTSVMKRLASRGAEAVSRFDRIASAALGDISNALSELPALTAGNDKAADQYLEQLDSKLLEHRQLKRKGKSLDRDEADAIKMAVNVVIGYIRSCGLRTSNQKAKFLSRVMGLVMEAEAVPGAIQAQRTPIPQGVIIKRGRPPMTMEEKRKAKMARDAKKRRSAA